MGAGMKIYLIWNSEKLEKGREDFLTANGRE